MENRLSDFPLYKTRFPAPIVIQGEEAETSDRRCSSKFVFLRIFQSSHENTCIRVCFFKKETFKQKINSRDIPRVPANV